MKKFTRPIYALLPALGLLLVLPLSAAEAGKKHKGNKKKKRPRAQAEQSATAPAPAATPLARSPEVRELDRHLRAYDTAAADELLRRVMDESDPDLVAARGRVLEQRKDYAAAKAELEAAARAAAEDPAPLLYLGETHLHAGDEAAADRAFASAAERARALVRRLPEDPEALYLLGVAQQRTRRFDEAVATLEEVRRRSPRDARVLYQLGVTRAFQERWAEAVDFLSEAIALDSGIAYAYYYRGLAAGRMNRKDLLVNDLDRFLAMAPDSPEAPKARKILESV